LQNLNGSRSGGSKWPDDGYRNGDPSDERCGEGCRAEGRGILVWAHFVTALWVLSFHIFFVLMDGIRHCASNRALVQGIIKPYCERG
jgi:hypothetical protein